VENDLTVASIFVNPTQFGPDEDFSSYPRTMEKDAALLGDLGVDVIFAPQTTEIYPDPPQQIIFDIRDLDKKLCGVSRPGHMNGVVQVVSILFNIVQPHFAYFGLKDYQQCLIIQQLVKELHFPVQVVPCPIVREEDGLAMSSRNLYLTESERPQAVFLSKTLQAVKEKLDSFGSVSAAHRFVQEEVEKYPLVRLDYFEILDGENLREIDDPSSIAKPHGFMAAFLGKSRLIDNLALY
ncbi:MAG: pantoate--beta-alanine ligase, partial [Bacteroidota bacterium]